MALIKCPTGWLVVPDETGNDYVPFFVHVRDEDIHWKENPVLSSYISNNTESGVDSVQALNPGTLYRIVRNGWAIDIQSDGLITATHAIKVDSSFVLESTNKTTLSKTVELPFFLKDNEYFNIQTTICTTDEDITCATSYVKINKTTLTDNDVTSTGYDRFDLVLNSPSFKFTEDFATECTNSKVFVTVRGYLTII